MSEQLTVGDIVEPVRGRGFYLRSGGSAYLSAVVVNVDPVILVSTSADMRWEATIQDKKFRVLGTAHAALLARCMRRLEN